MTERERLEEYVKWNQLARHQIIVAHLTLIANCDEVCDRLAKAFGIKSWIGLTDLADKIIAQRRAQ